LEAQDHASLSEPLRRQSEVVSFSGAALTDGSDDLRVSINAFQLLTEACGSGAVHDAKSDVITIIKKHTRAIAPPPCENRESVHVLLSDKPKVAQSDNCIRISNKGDQLGATPLTASLRRQANAGATATSRMLYQSRALARAQVFLYVIHNR
jgi:hypothetical protein